jgi:hypothetical protein
MSALRTNHRLVQIGKVLILVGLGIFLASACEEFYRLAPTIGAWFGKLTLDWGLAFVALIVFCAAIFAGAILLLWFPDAAQGAAQMLVQVRRRLGWLRWLLVIAVALLPSLFFLYTYWGAIFDGPALRMLALLSSSLVSGVLLTRDSSVDATNGSEAKLLDWPNFFYGALISGSLFAIALQFTTLTAYPFSLTWSEGNRLYDFSLYLGRERYLYEGELIATRGAAGRHLLWGLIYIFPNTPIWLHRLWNIVLSTAPYLLFGYLLARWKPADSAKNLPRLRKWGFALWIYLFLMQGPIYTPLLLTAILIVLTIPLNTTPERRKQFSYWLVCIAGTAIAGIYASASRWTWFPAAATWAVFLLMADFKIEKGESLLSIFRRLIPIGFVAAAGLAGGLAASPKLLTPEKIATGTAMSQPLLWYRLYPNATLTSGIIWGLVVAALPLLLLIAWLALSRGANGERRWPLNWLQILAYSSASLIFLGIGLIASVKIGGGNNLHNLDMFLVSLAILAGLALRNAGLALRQAAGERIFYATWPRLAQALLGLALFIPAWNAVKSGGPLQLPPAAVVEETLQDIQKKTSQAAQLGEVLFIDQRQLLTFGSVRDIPLVPDYEKKYLMDQAMAGDETYFETFYNDLKNRRFSLILIEPLFVKEKSQLQTFGEENNAWVEWVAGPLLCYYKPAKTFDETGIQLLTPRDAPKDGCPLEKTP